jgi:S-(hydroxymethyl)glutathione dehydrogenase/alcohol dehydrogenase
MRAAVLTEVGQPLALEDLADPPLAPTHVRVQVEASGVCHTDLAVQSGALPYPPPVVLGHEGAGTVLEVGSAVRLVRPGDRVVGSFTPTCHRCWHCRRGETHLCRDLRGMGIAHGVRADGAAVLGLAGLGSFAERITTSEDFLVPVRSDLPSEQLALLGCGATTGLGAVLNTAGVSSGETVAVLGCGGVGLFAVMGAVVAGAARVIAVDPVEHKRAHAWALGATDVVDPADGPVAEQVRALTEGRGADHVLEVVGSPDLMVEALAATRRGGTTVLVGTPPAGSTVTFDAFALHHDAKRLMGCTYGSAHVRSDFQRWADLAGSGRLDLGATISHRFPLDDVNAALDRLRRGEVLRGVLEPAR